MDRIDKFEKMLADIKARAAYETEEMQRLKAEGKEKTATYRQYFGNRVFYRMIFDKYREYGLLND